ncbi:hypothetical protein [Lactobacillus kefiranofaciens]|uniref:hypothetical protein n=1 Tax=Lactobacillus kefiranofaciens TaxID=267818 RepID=UPI001FB86E16|nr:hypothetical protein [Lactobacillus kefiranofaciens]
MDGRCGNQLSCEGITPVIVHPERNAQIIAEPQRLYKLAEDGVLAQVTASWRFWGTSPTYRKRIR